MRPLTSEQRAEIITATRDQVPQTVIARTVGVSRSSVAKVQREERERRTTRTATRSAALVGTDGSRAVEPVRVARGRQTKGAYSVGALKVVVPPTDEKSAWTSYDLDHHRWERMSFAQTVRTLIDIEPAFSRAVWDYLLAFDAGHEIVAYRPGTETVDARAQAALEDFLGVIRQRHGGIKVQTARIGMSLIMRGAFLLELVLDTSRRRPIDLVVPDPAIVRFQRQDDPELGEVHVIGQLVNGEWQSLDYPTIKYYAHHAPPDAPYGRSMLAPAVFPAIFLLGLMHDLRRVIAQQGYPRTKILLKIEALLEQYKDLDSEQFDKKVAELADMVEHEYSLLEPDDAFIAADTVDIQHASGAVDAGVVRGAEGLITALERMLTRALKTMPLLMGIAEGTSEANANRQWELWAQGISSLQQPAETALADLLTLALQVQGIRATVSVKFAKIRTADELRDEQTRKIKIENAIALENAGYVDTDEAATIAVGHKATGTKPATPAPEPEPSPEDEINPDPGSDRVTRSGVRVPWFGDSDQVRDVDEIIDDAVADWNRVFAGSKYELLLDAKYEPADEVNT